ncbi:MAG: Peptidase S8/S53 family [Fusobacteria bacterium]|nr:MAG: Peptidase S8/S53 family [Fusobacteriota bacterium]KAF0228600.1 MAG: Peptidase S8/S53 [Fusobacteriota bacterium]
MNNVKAKVKIKSKLLYSIVFLVLIGILSTYIWKLNSEKRNLQNNYIDDWAIYNYGQTIEGTKGTKGIDINILPAWKKILPKENIIVAVVDTGIDIYANNMSNNIERNKKDTINEIDDDHNGLIDDHLGWNFYDNNNTIYENELYDYYGTYIATTITKVNPKARIIPVKFLKSTMGTSNDAVEAISYAIKRGARIINCSWNFNEYNNVLYEVIRDNPDVLFVCSTGNRNSNIDKDLLYPCSYGLDNIINVLAIDNRGEIYEASGYGSSTVDLGAPGVDVKVTLPNNEVALLDGTSVAAAYVSGASSLILGKYPNLSAKEVKERIIKSATRLETLRNHCSSGGLLNVGKSNK